MGHQVDSDAAISLAFTAYEAGKKEVRGEMEQVTFTGILGASSTYRVEINGVWSAKSIGNLIKQLELYRGFAEEDEAEEAKAQAALGPPEEASPTDEGTP